MEGRRNYAEVYLHLVWGTWLRRRMLSSEARGRVYACIQADCQRLRCYPLAIGGTEDHVHLLVRMGTSVSIGGLVKQLKGSSSHLMNHQSDRRRGFRWQNGYGAFSVSPRHLPLVSRYIQHQEEHHRTGRTNPRLERTD